MGRYHGLAEALAETMSHNAERKVEVKRKKDYTLYLGQIIDEMELLISETNKADVTFGEFKHNRFLFKSVVNAVQNMGEASNRIPPSIKEKYAHLKIPWKDMRDMRNEIVHEYDNISMSRLWKTIKKDIPRDLPKIQEMRRLEEQRMKKIRKREKGERDGMEG